MAKGKKGKKGKKEKKPIDPNILTEVDKTFYELQITDLNRKLARLRSLTTELEEKNLELEQKFSKLDDDRNDVIAYLKRTLLEKQNEISELQERLTALIESKENEAEEHEEKIKELENEYKLMREQLTSEIKLLTGKLNALEEFRMQRDELMQKFEEQERNIEEQEIRHKRVLYDIEKKFILGKDAIKKEMEKQLFELGASFEQANNMRIAATTQRAIRENITINNEINRLILTNERLEKENYMLKTRNKTLELNCELYTKERNKALSDTRIQRDVIEQLTAEHNRLIKTLREYEVLVELGKQHDRDLRHTLQREENLKHKVRVLEQNLHATRCQEASLKTEILRANNYLGLYRNVMLECILVIKSAMLIQTEPDLEESLKVSKRENLLANLLTLLCQTKEELKQVKSLETVPSITATYAKGDLGFIPKVHAEKRPPPMKLNMDSQIGRSFEELLKSHPVESSDKSLVSAESIEEELVEEETEEILSLSPRPSAAGEGSEGSIVPVSSMTETVTEAEPGAEEEEIQSAFEVLDDGEMYGEYDYELEKEIKKYISPQNEPIPDEFISGYVYPEEEGGEEVEGEYEGEEG